MIDSKKKIIATLPLTHLETSRGEATCVGEVGAESIRELLKQGRVRFVIAEIGRALDWIAEENCFDFWKQEVQSHLAEPNQSIRLDQFSNQYAYAASHWDDGGVPITLLVKHH